MSADNTTRSLLRWAETELSASEDIPNARWEARHLLSDLTGWRPTDMVMEPDRPVPDPNQYHDWVVRRASGVPASRITGFRDFMGRSFTVSEGTLDPRVDSETLVEAALTLLPEDWAGQILDLGTGTGCLLLTILAERAAATGIGVDLSTDAVSTASRNATELGLQDRTTFEEGSWSAQIADRSVDLLISNPPYIRSDVLLTLEPAVTEHDPALALDGGNDGLAAYRAILEDAPRTLKDNGSLLFEIGWDQGHAVSALVRGAGFTDVRCIPDLGGRDRVIQALKP